MIVFLFLIMVYLKCVKQGREKINFKGGDITKTKMLLKLQYKIILICALLIAFIYLINSNMLNGVNLILYYVVTITMIKQLNDIIKYY